MSEASENAAMQSSTTQSRPTGLRRLPWLRKAPAQRGLWVRCEQYPNFEIPLGERCRFTLDHPCGAVKATVTLKVNGIVYPDAIAQDTVTDTLDFLAESPGKYTATIRWKSADSSQTGTTRVDFRMTDPHLPYPPTLGPAGSQRLPMWAPSPWELAFMDTAELATLSLIRNLLPQGAAVIDVGANVGVYAMEFAKMVGPTGHVTCIEANPLCVPFLRANLAAHSPCDFDILPMAVLDRRTTCPIVVNYDNSNVGVARDSRCSTGKIGHTVTVQADTLDWVVETRRLRPPSLIKMDIEGAEALAIGGMTRTLAEHRPVVFVELHGPDPAEPTVRTLADHGYTFYEPRSRREFATADAFMDWMPDVCLQLVAVP